MVLPRLEALDGLPVLVIDQRHGDHRVPALILPGAPEVHLLIVRGHDGEVDELAGALHAVHLLDGLQFQLFALGAPLRVRVHVEAVRGQDARLLLPELEEVVGSLLQLALLEDLAHLGRGHVDRLGRGQVWEPPVCPFEQPEERASRRQQ